MVHFNNVLENFALLNIFQNC